MYLVSIYFDDKSARKIQNFINKSAVCSGNTFMLDNDVPPHMTISAIETRNEKKLIEVLDKKIKNIKSGNITWASIGIFKSNVIFLTPVLSSYLHNLSVQINEELNSMNDMSINKYYMPFQWIPHTTIAKKLSEDELFAVFKVLQKNFTAFSGVVTKIALSRTNPHRDIKIWQLI